MIYILLLAIMAMVMVAAIGSHFFVVLRRIDGLVKKTSDRDFDTEALKRSLSLRQGSNFNTIVLSAWALFFVAFFFLYFLTPSIFPAWNYFNLLPNYASSEMGLSLLGFAVIVLLGIVAFSIPNLYRCYSISHETKRLMIYSPVMIIASMALSSYLGTIFPETNGIFWYVAYLFLLAAEVTLFLPIFRALLGGSY
jgi:hypothetical protein